MLLEGFAEDVTVAAVDLGDALEELLVLVEELALCRRRRPILLLLLWLLTVTLGLLHLLLLLQE